MRLLLGLVLFLVTSAGAQSVWIRAIEWSNLNVSDGERILGRIVLSAPSPTATKVIFEPTFHLELPTVVEIPAGQITVDFPVKIVDNRFITGGSTDVPKVTAYLNGQIWEGPGPGVRN